MPRMLDRDIAEQVIAKYFALTSPVFDSEMGARLRTVREKMGLTQKELAEQLGLSQADISRLENGKNITAPPKCDAFKNVLNGHLEYVLTRNGYWNYEEITWHFNKQTRCKVGSRKS